ncbi:hypothetical protein [Comamonas sp. NoAH]|uniref:hypothetical protein n=1 Tax=Comamonas halotolerans TaxID=3041496 RepID=UPI0024E18EF5|nr:hypothetical protein [Comamonas sp. NoAH]
MSATAPIEDLHEQMKAMGRTLKTLKPIKPKHLNKPAESLTVPEARERLRILRDRLLQKASAGRWHDAESKEWSHIGHEQRVMLMMLAGIDGDLDALAARAWREFTPPERAAIKSEIRAARRTFSRVAALCSRL